MPTGTATTTSVPRSGPLRRLLLGVAGLVAVSARAERIGGFFAPPGSFTVEISLDNSPYLRLPPGRNAVTSLEVVGAYAIGGTSARAGLGPFLFAVSLSERKLVFVLDLEAIVPGQRSILSGFGREQKGTLLAGTMPQKEGESGHLIRVTINEAGLRATDLGTSVPKEGVFALATDAGRGMVYGISHPSGKFFSFGLADGATRSTVRRHRTRQRAPPTLSSLWNRRTTSAVGCWWMARVVSTAASR